MYNAYIQVCIGSCLQQQTSRFITNAWKPQQKIRIKYASDNGAEILSAGRKMYLRMESRGDKVFFKEPEE